MLHVQSQNYKLSRTFTEEDGLPSNHIYDLCEDDKGFLWIATDNGISRYDGTHFFNYSIKNGLPSNDVLQIVKEKDGTVWANCYKQPPSYFDEKLNRFVSFENNASLLNVSESLLDVFTLEDGGILFQSNNGFVIFRNKKIISLNTKTDNRLLYIKGTYFYKSYTFINSINTIQLNDFNKPNKILGKIQIESKNNIQFNNLDAHNIIYFDLQHIYKIHEFEKAPFSYKIDSLYIPEPIKRIVTSNQQLHVIGLNGGIYSYDKNTFKVISYLKTNVDQNVAVIDQNRNYWIGTLENGIQYYNTSPIITVQNPAISNNFLSIHKTEDTHLLAGNFNGEIWDVSHTATHRIPSDIKIMWMRNIFSFGENTITLSDGGYSINYMKNKPIIAKNGLIQSIKTGLKLDESTLIIGTNTGIYKFNVPKQIYERINSPSERISNLQKIDDHSFYFIANKGVFKYALDQKNYSKVYLNDSLVNDRIDLITNGEDKNLWISTIKGNLILLQNNKIALKIPNSAGLPENFNRIYTFNKKLWIASKSGLYILDYTTFPRYSIHKLSKSDGLPSNGINSLIFESDTVYVATQNGIAKIPSHLKFSKFEITPLVTSLTINNLPLPILEHYKLEKDQKNIVIQLAGVELSGHFQKFQYTTHPDEQWIDLDGNTLNLSLKGGKTILNIRAIDSNNNISSRKLVLYFEVAIPFYNQIWFLLLFAFSLTGFIFWVFNSRKFENQKKTYEQQLALEQQRKKITADLHDDIGATLSSLQINSALAHKFIDQDIIRTKNVLTKIENQSHDLADKIGDIIWSMKPGNEGLMTFSMRIKNFANDIIGSTDIQYSIRINPLIDKSITDISIRKNLVLVCKEAINNAAKYSCASKIEIQFDMVQGYLIGSINDNGIGFDPLLIKGNGISNMQKRISELKGVLTIISAKETGTQLQIEIPFVP